MLWFAFAAKHSKTSSELPTGCMVIWEFKSQASGVLIKDDNCSVYTEGKHKCGKLVCKHRTHRDTQKYDTLGKLLVTILENLGSTKIGV